MILQKQITTSKSTILVIGGLPEDAENIRIDRYLRYFSDGDAWIHGGGLPPGDWQPLGFLKDITEDVAKELVDSFCGAASDYNTERICIVYNDYGKGATFSTALESLHSLIKSNCKLKNKYGDNPKSLDEYIRRSEDSNGVSFIDEAQRALYDLYLQNYKTEQSEVFTNPFLLSKLYF